MVKNLPANAGDIRDMSSVPGSGRSSGEGNGNPLTPVFLREKSHGQRSLVGYSPWGHKESDMTERLTLTNIKMHTFKYNKYLPRLPIMDLFF